MRGEKNLGPLGDGRLRACAVRLAAVAFWLVAWELAARAIDLKIILVGPSQVLVRLAELVATGEFWASVALSFGRIALGFLAALLLGAALAALASRWRAVRELVAPVMGAVKAVPVASFVILVLLWVSSRELSIVIAFLMALPVVYTNVLEGIEQTDPALVEMAEVFGIRGWERVRLVYASQVLPYARAAISLGLGLSWKAGIAAEVIGLPDFTIGEHLYDAKVYLDTPSLFAWTVAIVALSALVEWVVSHGMAAAQARWEARP